MASGRRGRHPGKGDRPGADLGRLGYPPGDAQLVDALGFGTTIADLAGLDRRAPDWLVPLAWDWPVLTLADDKPRIVGRVDGTGAPYDKRADLLET
jgi:hypothetical protein